MQKFVFYMKSPMRLYKNKKNWKIINADRNQITLYIVELSA